MNRTTCMWKGIFASILGIIIFYPLTITAQTDFSDPLDRKLYKAFSSNQFELFASSIELGGKPTERFGKTRDGWVMCASTEVGKEKYLRYLVNKNFDVNFRQSEIASRISTPLLCAINFGNIHAVKYLVANGADPTLKHCQPCTTDSDTSAIWMAIISSKYEIADWLYANVNLSTSKTLEIIELIEQFPFPTTSPENRYRKILINRLLADGYTVQEIN